MPRPRKNPNEVLTRELRITPPNGQPIKDWYIGDSILKLVAFEEGGDDTKKLHYHALIETTMTSQALPKWIYKVVNCVQTGERGNAVFFTREPHEGTKGYIAKCHKLSIRHGTDQSVIEEYYEQSDKYLKHKAANRKREQRGRTAEFEEVMKLVKKDLDDNCLIRNVDGVISAILKHSHHLGIRFPTRSQMESFVIKLVYPYDEEIVKGYYMRSFPKVFYP